MTRLGVDLSSARPAIPAPDLKGLIRILFLLIGSAAVTFAIVLLLKTRDPYPAEPAFRPGAASA